MHFLDNIVADLEALKERFGNAHWGQDLRDVASAVVQLADHVHQMAQHLASEVKTDAGEVASEVKADVANLASDFGGQPGA